MEDWFWGGWGEIKGKKRPGEQIEPHKHSVKRGRGQAKLIGKVHASSLQGFGRSLGKPVRSGT